MNAQRQRQLEIAYQRLRSNMLPKPTEVIEVDPKMLNPLHGVQFASTTASELARSNGLTWKDFGKSMVTPSRHEGYTTRDVRKILEEADASHR